MVKICKSIINIIKYKYKTYKAEKDLNITLKKYEEHMKKVEWLRKIWYYAQVGIYVALAGLVLGCMLTNGV